jgi:predicted site-specific integrase-resolvase
MEPVKIDRTKLITPKAYAELKKVSPAAVNKMMNTGRVKVVNVTGGRLILLD